ncbi:hypothetical protein HC752_11505 [Vibrio sp. S9_S30]|uniref:hypothetical protein n=1 Tax=Vibrio sp. S9_S30 TaxID=2720226 RepID=UPI001680113B|nr:hypothetical protein [Vibrio sp. S9_S30]MBD1557556.1 hypothetical protein [Vibrio sp. S9_S30]
MKRFFPSSVMLTPFVVRYYNSDNALFESGRINSDNDEVHEMETESNESKEAEESGASATQSMSEAGQIQS